MLTVIISLAAGFALSQLSERMKGAKDERRRRTNARRLLAHHAYTLHDEATHFLAVATRLTSLPEAEVAYSFGRVTTSERIERNEIMRRLDDLSDSLITSFIELDGCCADAAHEVRLLQQSCGQFHESVGSSGRESYRPQSLSEELQAAMRAPEFITPLGS